MIDIFRSLTVGERVSFQVTDFFVKAECLHVSPDWFILKRLDGDGYYDIFIEGEKVRYRWHETVH